jgi:hypothetical protein
MALVFCSECEYWLQNDDIPEYGQCRRNAPSPVQSAPITQWHQRAVWLLVRVQDCCGQGVKGTPRKTSEITLKQETILDTRPKISAFDDAVNKAKAEIRKK